MGQSGMGWDYCQKASNIFKTPKYFKLLKIWKILIKTEFIKNDKVIPPTNLLSNDIIKRHKSLKIGRYILKTEYGF